MKSNNPMDHGTRNDTTTFEFLPALGTLKGIRLHSKARPGAEVMAQISNLPKDTSPLMIIGLGLGMHLSSIQETFPHQTKLVLELHSEVWIQSQGLQKRYLETYPDQWGFYFWNNLDQFASFLSLISPNEASPLPRLVVLPAYRTIYKDWIDHCTSTIQQKHERKIVNSATLQRFGKLWLRNTLRNIHRYTNCFPVQRCFGRFSGIPAILLGAGPSLDDLLPWVAENQNKFLVMAVDTALRPALSHGIRVDFTMILEPQYWNTRHLDFIHNPDVLVVTEISTHPRAYQSFTHVPLMAGSTYPLGTFLEQGYYSRLGAGGSIATSAWDFLNRLGVSEIILAGIDLAFPNLHTHVAGSLSEQLLLTQATRYLPSETGNFAYLQSGIPIQVTNNLGQPVISDKRMNIYATWFESQLDHISLTEGHDNLEETPTKTYTLSAQARKLKGIPFLDPEKRNHYQTYPLIAHKIQEILRTYKQDNQKKKSDHLTMNPIVNQVQTSLSHLVTEIDQVITLSTQGLDSVNNFRSGNLSINELLNFLDEVDQHLSALPGKRVFGFLMEDVIQKIQSLPRPESFEGTIERTCLLYQAFHDSAQWLKTEFQQGFVV